MTRLILFPSRKIANKTMEITVPFFHTSFFRVSVLVLTSPECHFSRRFPHIAASTRGQSDCFPYPILFVNFSMSVLINKDSVCGLISCNSILLFCPCQFLCRCNHYVDARHASCHDFTNLQRRVTMIFQDVDLFSTGPRIACTDFRDIIDPQRQLS